MQNSEQFYVNIEQNIQWDTTWDWTLTGQLKASYDVTGP